MALFNKEDFIGTHVIDSAAKRDLILDNSNNRGSQHFNSMAPYGGTTTTPPLSLDDMLQTYTLDAAAVEVVLQNSGSGLRGHEFLTGVNLVAFDATMIITKAPGTVPDPAVLLTEGFFNEDAVITLSITTDVSGVVPVVYTMPANDDPVGAAERLSRYINETIPEISSAWKAGTTELLIRPYEPNITCNIDTAIVV